MLTCPIPVREDMNQNEHNNSDGIGLWKWLVWHERWLKSFYSLASGGVTCLLTTPEFLTIAALYL